MSTTPEDVVAGVLTAFVKSKGPVIEMDIPKLSQEIVAAIKRIKAARQGTAQEEIDRSSKEQRVPEDVLDAAADHAIDQASRIIDMCDELPEAGWEFGESVSEKCHSIILSIENFGSVTGGQQKALDNMEEGVSRWFRE